jgi:hypothetical protein
MNSAAVSPCGEAAFFLSAEILPNILTLKQKIRVINPD